MKNFDLMRRNFLRTSSLGAGAAVIPAVSIVDFAQQGGAATLPTQGVFDVHAYGATGDGKTLDTAAVNRAIDAASTAGGGIVIFPAGSYLCFSIHLKSQVHLHLLQGSAIVAADSPRADQQQVITAVSTTQQNHKLHGMPIRTTDITIGITHCCGEKISTT
jgi:polygalacturonase